MQQKSRKGRVLSKYKKASHWEEGKLERSVENGLGRAKCVHRRRKGQTNFPEKDGEVAST